MGFYARDGSYVREAGDDMPRETQGQAFERGQRVIAQAEAYDAEERRKKEAEREFNANEAARYRQYEERKAKEKNQRIEQERIEEEKRKNKARYGVDYDLRHPKDLNERRHRANFWRINNNFRLLVDTVIGKNYRFGKLWDQYSAANTDEERQALVEKMERMYPTREFAVRGVEKKSGYRK